jgi:catalase
MQSVLGGTVQKAGEVVSHAMSSNKKVSDMKSGIREPTTSDRLASDFGVKTGNTDVWLSASTEEHKGPALLEDNFGREKVRLSPSNKNPFNSYLPFRS